MHSEIWFCAMAMALVGGVLPVNTSLDNERRFYIFDWPRELTSSWPEPNTTLIPHAGRMARPLGYKHEDGTNYGAGKLLNESIGLFSTNYFHLYHIIMSRLRVHPKRTYNRSEATMFVVPFDAGIAAQWNKRNGQYRMHQLSGGEDVVLQLTELFRNDVQHTPLFGHDVLMINSLFNLFNGNISKLFFECANCTVINHDTNRAYDNYHYTFAKRNMVQLASAQFGVPYMSAVHWHDNVTDILWRPGQDRPVLVAYWASLSVQHKLASTLRKKLAENCEDRSDVCVCVHVTSRHAEPCYSKDAVNCHTDHPVQNASLPQSLGVVGLDLYRISQYCLQPPGDMDGRKALSDSILFGCIPVYFHAHLLSEKYAWFFSLDMERKAALYIPWQDIVQSTFNAVDYIASIPPEVTKSKQKALAKLAETFVYSVPPQSLQEYIGFGGAPGVKEGAVWAPPFKDAVDVIVDSTFERIERYAIIYILRIAGLIYILLNSLFRFKKTGFIPPHEQISSQSKNDLIWKQQLDLESFT